MDTIYVIEIDGNDGFGSVYVQNTIGYQNVLKMCLEHPDNELHIYKKNTVVASVRLYKLTFTDDMDILFSIIESFRDRCSHQEYDVMWYTEDTLGFDLSSISKSCTDFVYRDGYICNR